MATTMIFRFRHLALALLLPATGCFRAPQSPPYDSQRAKQTLILTLEAWKAGRPAELAERDPPIRFEDEDCRNGLHLVEYRLDEGEPPPRPFEDVRATLVLRDGRGNTAEKHVAYQVALAPDLAVLRSD